MVSVEEEPRGLAHLPHRARWQPPETFSGKVLGKGEGDPALEVRTIRRTWRVKRETLRENILEWEGRG